MRVDESKKRAAQYTGGYGEITETGETETVVVQEEEEVSAERDSGQRKQQGGGGGAAGAEKVQGQSKEEAKLPAGTPLQRADPTS